MPAGSKPGERRGGRKRGTRNKATRDIKELAQKHCAEAIEQLALILKHSDSHAARVAAIKELLDRGYGKSPQAVEVTGKDGEPIQQRVVLSFD